MGISSHHVPLSSSPSYVRATEALLQGGKLGLAAVLRCSVACVTTALSSLALQSPAGHPLDPMFFFSFWWCSGFQNIQV